MQTKQTDSNTHTEQPSTQREIYIEQIAQSLENILRLELQMIEEHKRNVQ